MTPEKINATAKRIGERLDVHGWWLDGIPELDQLEKLAGQKIIKVKCRDCNGFRNYSAEFEGPAGNKKLGILSLVDYQMVTADQCLAVFREAHRSGKECPTMHSQGGEGLILVESHYRKPQARMLRHCVEDWAMELSNKGGRPRKTESAAKWIRENPNATTEQVQDAAERIEGKRPDAVAARQRKSRALAPKKGKRKR